MKTKLYYNFKLKKTQGKTRTAILFSLIISLSLHFISLSPSLAAPPHCPPTTPTTTTSPSWILSLLSYASPCAAGSAVSLINPLPSLCRYPYTRPQQSPPLSRDSKNDTVLSLPGARVLKPDIHF